MTTKVFIGCFMGKVIGVSLLNKWVHEHWTPLLEYDTKNLVLAWGWMYFDFKLEQDLKKVIPIIVRSGGKYLCF